MLLLAWYCWPRTISKENKFSKVLLKTFFKITLWGRPSWPLQNSCFISCGICTYHCPLILHVSLMFMVCLDICLFLSTPEQDQNLEAIKFYSCYLYLSPKYPVSSPAPGPQEELSVTPFRFPLEASECKKSFLTICFNSKKATVLSKQAKKKLLDTGRVSYTNSTHYLNM